MLLRAYSIRDSKGEFYHPPFFKRTHGEAERDFMHLCKDEKSMTGQYTEDYDLYYLGTYDDQTGKIQATSSPEHMIKGVHAKQRHDPMTQNENLT
ncbi:MAG: nonstructural protein [Microvirus sp.]|nr:MAG: nonstructural protein [Microvirus sp.]